MRHSSIKFNVTELFAFASQPGSGFSKGTVSCDFYFFFKNPTCPPSLMPSRTERVLAAAEIIPSICVPHGCCAGALSSLCLACLGAGLSLAAPADGGCFPWLLALWVYLFFQGRLGGKRRITGCWGFFFLIALEETVSPLARRAAHGSGSSIYSLRAGRGMFPSPVRGLGLWPVCHDTLKIAL